MLRERSSPLHVSERADGYVDVSNGTWVATVTTSVLVKFGDPTGGVHQVTVTTFEHLRPRKLASVGSSYGINWLVPSADGEHLLLLLRTVRVRLLPHRHRRLLLLEHVRARRPSAPRHRHGLAVYCSTAVPGLLSSTGTAAFGDRAAVTSCNVSPYPRGIYRAGVYWASPPEQRGVTVSSPWTRPATTSLSATTAN